jgi:hypothetical protein
MINPKPLARVVIIATILAGAAAAAVAQERGPAGTVTLSRTDYDRLLDLAGGQPRPPDGAPLPAALTRTEIRVRVEAGVVRAAMTVEGEVFQTGAVKVPLIANATLLDARTADRPLPLLAEGNAHVAVVNGPATFSATLDWGSAITTSPGRGSFVLPVPPAGSATATFDVPGEQSDLRVSPGLVLRRTSAAGRTTIEAALDPGTATQVWWSARETNQTAVPRDVRMLADVKTLITIGDADLRLLSLLDLTIVQGEPAQFDVQIPPGYELAGVTGVSLERTEQQSGRVTLFVSAPSRRRHQFLLNLERAVSGSFKLETAFPTIPAAQRETGEVAVEGIGTLEISSAEIPGLRRMDVREVDPAISSAARQALLSAYRYQRGAAGVPTLAAAVTRFPDAAVLAAVADRAIATTLLTSQGRALTEITLQLRNRAQPFMRVVLPQGATMLSADVAGAAAKPAEGADGMRIPLLRPGFRPEGPYKVSFVYLHAGPAFAKKGDMQMTLPRMDVPVSVVEWELFVPDQYRADRFSGTAIAAHLIHTGGLEVDGSLALESSLSRPLAAGQIAGRVVDPSGAILPGATVTAQINGRRLTAVSDHEGRYVLSNVPAGPLVVTGFLEGFKTGQRSLSYDERPRQVDFQLAVGAATEMVTVTADAPLIDTSSAATTQNYSLLENARRNAADREQRAQQQAAAPSVNVQSLQRRAAGVLPVRIDVPRAGSSHRFVKPLVVDEETVVGFRYKRR